MLILALALCACSGAASPAQTSLYTLDVNTRQLQLVLPSSVNGYWGPAWSPDGHHLVFTFATLGSGTGELYLANPDGSGLRQLTHNGRSNYLPAWSPDGQVISFISQTGDTKTAELYTIRFDGSDDTRLTNNDAWEYGTSWSPDGTRIVFGSERGGVWQFYTMAPDGSGQSPLPTAAEGNAPVWSPDARQIAFTSHRDGDDDIWIMNSDGSDQRNLTNNSAWDDTAQWSPDGRHILFVSDRDGGHNIFLMDPDGSGASNLTKELDLDAGIATWAPDSGQIAFHASPAPWGLAALFTQQKPQLLGGVVLALFLAGIGVFALQRIRKRCLRAG